MADIAGYDRAGNESFMPENADPGALDALYGVAGNGLPLAQLFTGVGAEAAQNGVNVMNAALATGTNPRSIATDLSNTLGVSQARALTIARTEMLGAWRDAQLINFRANSDVLDGWIWSSSLAGACFACVMMDGTVHPLSEELDGHPNCACSPIPLTKSWDDLLGDLEGIDTSALAETDYLNSGYADGLQWFLQQDAALQREILGPAKYEAWRAGDVDLIEFVGQRDAGAWGNEIYERSLKEIGLDANAYLGRTTLADVTSAAEETATGAATATEATTEAVTTEAATETAAVEDTFSTERISADALEQEMDRAVEAIHPSNALDAASEAKARVSAELAQRLEGNPEFDKVRAIYEQRQRELFAKHPVPGWTQAQVDAEIAARTTPEAVASDLLHAWASGNDSAYSALQQAVRDEFSLTDAIRLPRTDTVRAALAEWADAQPGLRAFVREMYNNTQEWLEANGITELPLYRGMGFDKLPKGFDASLLDGQVHDLSITMRAASSFSVVPGQALHFAQYPVSDIENIYYSQIIAARVPASLILATPQTGFGALDEYEVVVLGGQYDAVMVGVDNKAFYTASFEDIVDEAVTKATVTYDQLFSLLAEDATDGG